MLHEIVALQIIMLWNSHVRKFFYTFLSHVNSLDFSFFFFLTHSFVSTIFFFFSFSWSVVCRSCFGRQLTKQLLTVSPSGHYDWLTDDSANILGHTPVMTDQWAAPPTRSPRGLHHGQSWWTLNIWGKSDLFSCGTKVSPRVRLFHIINIILGHPWSKPCSFRLGDFSMQ